VRFSTYRTSGGSGVGVWDGDRLHPVPDVTRLVDLLGDDPLWYSQPVFYFTNPAATRGAHADVAYPPGSAALDYEVEVAALIGREGADLTPADAVGHIAGFMLFCDWSARDLQGAEMRLNLGPAKGKDSANSFGPWLVTVDELAPLASRNGYDVPLGASVNGVTYSRGNLADLYWSFGEMIAYASRGTRVRPGDVIGSGTVGTGCILELSRVHGADAYPYLHPGDQVRLDGGPFGAIEARVTTGHPEVPLRPKAEAGR
jgi:2-keto-4-pentenoate hydratase/2-oxohepta-3-ene-1,7-dioic acid hydratase in catechol pathway